MRRLIVVENAQSFNGNISQAIVCLAFYLHRTFVLYQALPNISLISVLIANLETKRRLIEKSQDDEVEFMP